VYAAVVEYPEFEKVGERKWANGRKDKAPAVALGLVVDLPPQTVI
jgi:hypothetical protein